ncbi:hypothetical protein H5410_013399 [Solanum commersonii]|uniref:Uncharacterized protein n=1 Tax=Solanum commersonii TaxID=4109 RepID=A0A9J6AUD8_SOLCO|nr:hypothetical protein H5410_013399 [Solanum commersonii]
MKFSVKLHTFLGCGNVAYTESKLDWMLLLWTLQVLGEEMKGKKLKRCHAGNIEHYQISINSYRLQGITKSAQRFVPIPFAPDGLTEEFYDLAAYNPAESKFIMKLQVHPERMSQEDGHEFELLIRQKLRTCASLEDEHMLLVCEFMPRGSLENHLFRKECLFPTTIIESPNEGYSRGS